MFLTLTEQPDARCFYGSQFFPLCWMQGVPLHVELTLEALESTCFAQCCLSLDGLPILK